DVTTQRRRAPTLLARLALTTANRESLVLWSPPSDRHPAVVFTADSDLTNVSLPRNLWGAIVTAPHHGSEANREAYIAVRRSCTRVTWVRSDGQYRKRPGPSFIGFSRPSRRICTRCRAFPGEQAVRLFARRKAWTRHAETALCRC